MSTQPKSRPRPTRSPTRSGPRVHEYAVILDHHRATFPNHWPIVRIGRSLVAAGSCRQYAVVIDVRPRSRWLARPCRRVQLVHVPTGGIHPGKIFELQPRPLPASHRPAGRVQGAAALIAVALGTLALGCAAPSVTRRYASATRATAPATNEFARLSAFVLPGGSGSGAPLLATLGPQAQANFIRAMDDRSPDTHEFLQLLTGSGAGAVSPRSGDGAIDRTRFRRRLVFSVEKTDALGPADRIETVTIRLARLGHAQFLAWDKFATQYETVDLGKLTLTRGRTFEAGPGTPTTEALPLPVTGRAELKINRTLEEELTLRQRYVALSGALQPDQARLTQEGAVGIDLAGNAVVELEIEATAAPAAHDVLHITGLGPGPREGRDRAPAPTVRRVPLRHPARVTPITCELDGRYTVRQVLRGEATLIEGDDQVRFVTGAFEPTPVLLVDRDDLATRVWGLRAADDQIVYVAGVGVAEFASYTEAATCCAAVRASTEPKIAGHELRLGGDTGPALTKDQLAAVVVHVRQLN